PQTAKAMEAVFTEAELTIFRTELEILDAEQRLKALDAEQRLSKVQANRNDLLALKLVEAQAALEGTKQKLDAATKRRDQIATSLKIVDRAQRDGSIQNRIVQLETVREMSRQLTQAILVTELEMRGVKLPELSAGSNDKLDRVVRELME